jgi:acyl-CoA synthetase (AMP-forming)/AMP-acid ligase II
MSSQLADLLDDLCGRYGDRPALIWASGQMTYAELAARADATARGLASIGAGKGTRLGILMPNCAEWLATAFAAWKLGAVVVPLNTLSRRPELEHALRHADVSVLVAVPTFLKHDYVGMIDDIRGGAAPLPEKGGREGLARALPASVNLPSLRQLILKEDLDALVTVDPPPAAWLQAMQSSVVPSDVAAIFFTSGTTALPKGVVHTHASMLHSADNLADRLGLTADDRTWGYLPFFFTGGLVAVALATLSRGGAVLLQEVFDAGDTLKLMSRHRCTTLFAWPHQAEAIISHPDFEKTELHLRKGVGANTKWAGRLYPSDHRAVGTWGMTETGPMATSSSHDEPLEVRAGAHGRAMPGVELRVVDPQSGSDLAVGEEGELLVRGAPLMQHYYKMTRDQCFDADGFFHTGDLARLDAEGRLHFLGRLKDVIKTAGVNVAAAEVEAVLQQHPAVKVAHVVGVPHPTRGENVAAVIILRASGSESNEPSTIHQAPAAALTTFCKERLASYKVPRRFTFMSESELPVLGSGKVDKQALRNLIVKAT